MATKHDRNDLKFAAREIESMAELLKTRYGVIARGVAEFLAFQHERANDDVRSRAWNAVAAQIAAEKPLYH